MENPKETTSLTDVQSKAVLELPLDLIYSCNFSVLLNPVYSFLYLPCISYWIYTLDIPSIPHAICHPFCDPRSDNSGLLMKLCLMTRCYCY